MKTFGRLREKIKEKYSINEKFARAMGMDKSTLSLKLNEKNEWRHTEIEKACKLLDIPIEQVPDYFFYQ